MARETESAPVGGQTGGAEKAFLIAVDTGEDPGWTAEESLKELAALAETAGAVVVGRMWQNRAQAHPTTYLGKGKLEELVLAKEETGFDFLVADDELSPKQLRSFEDLLKVKVLDRSGLILDIFAQRAQTAEGRLQVELAQLQYQLPRLTRLWAHLSRMGGGIGTRRGPGETQLETDRRVIRQRIAGLKERVEGVRQRRETAARARDRRLIPTVAVVGYTNAGKSTLLNALVGEEVAAVEDKLFATLDPTSRRVGLGEGQTVIATDTVGFIHKLPHQLIDAFRATLEEVTRADVLLIVVDASDAHAPEHLATVTAVLDELGAGHTPRLVACNKVDLVHEERGGTGPCAVLPARVAREAVPVSALCGEGIADVRARLAAVLAGLWVDVDVVLPYSAGELLARVRERGAVEFEYGDLDVRVRGRVAPALAGGLVHAGSAWKRALRAQDRVEDDNGKEPEVAEAELLSAGKVAEKLGVSAAKVSKYLKESGLEPDQLKGRCGYFGPEKVKAIEEGLKAK
jgi:GTPase